LDKFCCNDGVKIHGSTTILLIIFSSIIISPMIMELMPRGTR
jgi:hypothetical protein